MPIIYIHGVNTRSRESFEDEIRVYLRRYIAPVISDQPQSVLIDDAYWGDVAVKFAFGGISRPRSQLLGLGAAGPAETPAVERALLAGELGQRLPDAPAAAETGSGGLLAGGAPAAAPKDRPLDLRPLTDDELSDFLAGVIHATAAAKERGNLAIAADDAAHDKAVRAALAQQSDPQKQIDLLLGEVQKRSARAAGALLGQGAPVWVQKLGDRARESLSRGASLPAYAASVAAAEFRKPLNDLISVFVGDVFQYLSHRGQGTAPGEIPNRLLSKLADAQINQQQRNGEPIVVLSHSMGGQIVYDAVTHFLPADPKWAGLKIDFWCATASQVGFFEETKLFLISQPQYKTGNPVPFPGAYLKAWWNLWDSNDVLSFTAGGIFNGVDDESFSSGMSLVSAHSGYWQRPSFYRLFAQKIQKARA